MSANILVLGLGNFLLCDEGFGIRALELLQSRYDLPENVDCVDGGVLGLELLAYVKERTHLLAIDAVQNGQEPGTLVRLEGDEIPQGLSIKLSMHQVRFADILALSLLRGAAPPRLVVWGMVPASLNSGVELSEVVDVRLGELVENVAGELRQWSTAVVPKPKADSPPPMERMVKREYAC